MTEMASHYFVFYVLPAVFIAIWVYVLLYTHRVKARMKQLAGPGRSLASEEAGIATVVLERERRSGKTGTAWKAEAGGYSQNRYVAVFGGR